MFKKQKIDSSLYAVFDKSAGILREFTVGVTAGNACRDILLTLRVPLNDSELVKLGDFVRDVPVTSPAGSLLLLLCYCQFLLLCLLVFVLWIEVLLCWAHQFSSVQSLSRV